MSGVCRYILSVFLLVVASAAGAEDIPRGSINFMVVSDLGAFGGADQKEVAATMGEVASSWHPTAILNLGDTFHFWGAQSVDDPGWNSNFEDIYTNPWLHSLWYCALGNHDYQGNTQALVDYTAKSRRWNMPERFYSKTFKSRDVEVEVIFIDSTPFLHRACSQPEIYPDACLQDTTAQLRWLDETLAASTADWVIVAAHHPLFSSRKDSAGQRHDLQTYVAPVVLRHAPDFYLAGDVHCFEHFTAPGEADTDLITCTSGSEAYPVDTPDPKALFTSGLSGFCTLAISKDEATATMRDKTGKELYRFTRKKKNPK
ncbi:MAG: metallophosphoesterase [Muribaculaceae bacterium]|nr:metallophosphoesterase [Muribaculaceae bacterium]